METIDRFNDIKFHIAAVKELTTQVVELGDYPGERERLISLDYARLAVQEKLDTLVKDFENYLHMKRMEEEK